MWVKRTNDDLALLENGLILDKDQEQSIINYLIIQIKVYHSVQSNVVSCIVHGFDIDK